MKIVYLSNSLIPSRSANSIHVMKMCAAFSANGHHVRLLAPSRPGREANVEPADIFRYYGVEESFDVQFLAWPGMRGSSYVYAMLAAWRARRNRADIVYTRFLSGGVAAALTGSPVIYEAHKPVHDLSRGAGLLFGVLRKHSGLKRIVVITAALKRRFVEDYPELEDRIVVAHDGADPVSEHSAHSEKANLRGSSSGLQAGYVGQLFPGKGIELIDPLAQLCPDVQFHIVGGTEQDVALWRSKLEQRNNVHFYGFVAPGKVQEYLSQFDVVLAPYQRKVSVFGGHGDVAQWMSPLKLFEYMASARAIVCADLPVLREVLREEQTALFCDPDSAVSWSAALARLDRDPAFRQSLGLQAREDFLRQYTWVARAALVVRDIEPTNRDARAILSKDQEKLTHK